MTVGKKDAVRLYGVSIMIFCAVLVCTMFLNFLMDISAIRPQISEEPVLIFYNAQVATAKVVCLITGGCLGLTTVVMLFFYTRHYIDIHKRELGILKALGYSAGRISGGFSIFSISILTGAIPGFAGAFLLMPKFYALQNEDGILPDFPVSFHPILLICMIVLPALFFAGIAVFSAYLQLQKPALCLLKNLPAPRKQKENSRQKQFRHTEKSDSLAFLPELKRDTLKSRKMLIFFIIFAAFCFSAMTQMSFSMKDLSSEMMGAMMLLIGLLLSFTTMLLAMSTMINGNKKTIVMMRVFGYTHWEISQSLLGIYRPLAYIGFAVGSIYQYVLLKIMVDIVFREIGNLPEFHFRWREMFLSLALFAVFYESALFYYTRKLRKLTVKEIMLD